VIITPTAYWNVIHGGNAEEALKDEEGMMILRTAGKNMAWLLKSIAAGNLPPPEDEPKVRTNFIR
jgi:hypothetical protein